MLKHKERALAELGLPIDASPSQILDRITLRKGTELQEESGLTPIEFYTGNYNLFLPGLTAQFNEDGETTISKWGFGWDTPDLVANDKSSVGSANNTCQLPTDDTTSLFYVSQFDIRPIAVASATVGFKVKDGEKPFKQLMPRLAGLERADGNEGYGRMFALFETRYVTDDYEEQFGFRYRPCTTGKFLKAKMKGKLNMFPDKPVFIDKPVYTDPTLRDQVDEVIEGIEYIENVVTSPSKQLEIGADVIEGIYDYVTEDGETEVVSPMARPVPTPNLGYTHMISGAGGFSNWSSSAWPSDGGAYQTSVRGAEWNGFLARNGWPGTAGGRNDVTTGPEMEALNDVLTNFWATTMAVNSNSPIFVVERLALYRLISAEGDARGDHHHQGWDLRPFVGTSLAIPNAPGLWFIRNARSVTTDNDGNRITQSQYHFIPQSEIWGSGSDDWDTAVAAGFKRLFERSSSYRVITHQHVVPSANALVELDTYINSPANANQDVYEVTSELFKEVIGYRVFAIQRATPSVVHLADTVPVNVNGLHYHVEFGSVKLVEQSSNTSRARLRWQRNNVFTPTQFLSLL
jgi:hypothetical protein